MTPASAGTERCDYEEYRNDGGHLRDPISGLRLTHEHTAACEDRRRGGRRTSTTAGFVTCISSLPGHEFCHNGTPGATSVLG
jgi:hypothetical protein